MNPIVLQFLPVIGGLLLSLGQTFVKGNKKYLIAIIAYFLLKYFVDKAATEKAKDNLQVKIDPVTGNPITPTYMNATDIAKAYRAAFDPLGTGFIGWNGTDTEALYELAGKAINWDSVKAAYKTSFKSDLEADLKSELSTSELKTFNDILKNRFLS